MATSDLVTELEAVEGVLDASLQGTHHGFMQQVSC